MLAHVTHLETVFRLLHRDKLFVNQKKCDFGKSQLTYLGHIVSAKGVAMDPSKVQAMLDWHQPRTLVDLRGFLGLTGYYRKFVQRYRQIAGPLTEQLKKGCYLWNEEACTTFQRLKTAMT